MPLVKCPEAGCVRFIETENNHSITEWLGLHTCSNQVVPQVAEFIGRRLVEMSETCNIKVKE